MTDDQLDELERLHRAATPGPFQASGDACILVQADQPADDMCIGELDHQADADLVAAVLNALPELLAEVRRLRAIVVDYQQGMICRFCHSRPCHCEVTSP